MDVRPQAHEIISFWLFNTVVKSRLHFDKTPWKHAMISGFVTLKGEKMSKSKGNVVRPQEVVEKFGADAIRYWAASSKLGDDFDYQEKDVQTGKKFVTKLLNVANFVFMNIQPPKTKPVLVETDQLVLNRLHDVVEQCTQSFDEFNYAKAKSEADYFFWHDLADNYLELVKRRVYEGTEEEKASAAYTLYHVLLTVLKLMSPFTSYVAEEVYQKHFRSHEGVKSIHVSPWPDGEKDSVFAGKKYSAEDDEKWKHFLELISLIRGKKSEAKKSMKTEVILTLPPEDQNALIGVLNDLKAVSNAKEIRTGTFNVDVL
jgi:valyl-tRNA synthetase